DFSNQKVSMQSNNINEGININSEEIIQNQSFNIPSNDINHENVWPVQSDNQINSQVVGQEYNQQQNAGIQSGILSQNTNYAEGESTNPVNILTNNQPLEQQYNNQQNMNIMQNQSVTNSVNPSGLVGQTNSNYSQNNKSKNNLILIVIGVCIAIIIGLVCIFASFALIGASKNNNQNEITEERTMKVGFNGFTFAIPVNYVYEVKGETLIIGDEEDTWVIQLRIFDGSYNQLVKNKSTLKPKLEKEGVTVSEAVIKSLGSTNWLTIEASMSGENVIIGYMKATASKVFAAISVNSSNDFNYESLKTVGKFLSTAEYSDTINNFKTNVDISTIINATKE
ncbi:MAG: hypothetical protein RSB54_00275, partial [Bacilli bacterium]